MRGSSRPTATEDDATDGMDHALAVFAAAPHRVVALDFDGVLAPLVPNPEDSTPLPDAVAALRRLAARSDTDLGLVSGRAVADRALGRAAVPGAAVIGSHGAERGTVGADGSIAVTPPDLDDDATALLASVRADGDALVSGTPGAWLEIKPTAVVVHTRRVDDEDAAAALEARALADLGERPGVRAIAGKRVVELSVAHATKGDAVTLLRDGFPTARSDGRPPVMYIGDDVTDEDARSTLGDGAIGIKVGDGDTAARFRVDDPAAVAAVLTRLADLLDSR